MPWSNICCSRRWRDDFLLLAAMLTVLFIAVFTSHYVFDTIRDDHPLYSNVEMYLQSTEIPKDGVLVTHKHVTRYEACIVNVKRFITYPGGTVDDPLWSDQLAAPMTSGGLPESFPRTFVDITHTIKLPMLELGNYEFFTIVGYTKCIPSGRWTTYTGPRLPFKVVE